MGLFTRKKKQQQQQPQQPLGDDERYSPSLAAPSTSHLAPSPEPSLKSPSLRTQRQGSAASSSRFSNPFRSSSFSSAPPSPSTTLLNADPQHRSSALPSSAFNPPPRDAQAHLRVDTRHPKEEGSWDDLGVPLAGSPEAYSPHQHQQQQQGGSPIASLNRFKLFGGGGGSSVSLPLPPAQRRESMEQETLREQQVGLQGQQQQQAYELEVEKKSRWKLGRGGAAKRRSGSVGSTLSMSQVTGGGLGIGGQQQQQNDDEDGGFFVRSFRTVSRVQDPITTGPYESLPPASSPPLPALPPPSPQQIPQRLSFDHDSHRSMSASSSSAPRPPLNTRSPGSNSWTNVADRAPSPTISVEAFRFASSRSKSTVSLASMGEDQPLERPRFEPSERRRSSFRSESDVGVGVLAPPRPQYARQHSRSSSNNSSSSDVRSQQQQQQQGMNQSDSVASVASYATAPERPQMSREASSETELKLIAMYGTSPQLTQGTLTPSNSTPFISSLPFESGSSDFEVERLASSPPRAQPTRRGSTPLDSTTSSPYTPTAPRHASVSAPSVAVQPPTPVTDPTFVPPPQRAAMQHQQSPTASRGRTVSAMAASSATKGKGKARGWNSDSSEEEEDSDDSEDDDVPLANIRSRSQTDLSLYANHNSSGSMLMLRKGSSEVEVLAEPKVSPPKPTPSPSSHTSRESIGRGTPPLSAQTAGALLRQGSQRRSVSTLSFSNPMAATTAASHAPSVSLSTPPQPTLGFRSHSNPSSPASTVHTFLPSSTTTSLLPSLTSSASTTPTMSAASSYQPRIVSSSSSGSGSGSGSSAPRTPKDHSPAVSDLGMKSNGSTARSSVSVVGGGSLFGDEERRQVKFADNASQPSLGGGGAGSKFGRRMSAQPLNGAAPPVRASIAGPPRSSSMANLHQSSLSLGATPKGGAPSIRASGSLASFAQQQQQQRRSVSNGQPSPTTPTTASSSASTAGPSSARQPGSVFDRMKARHKAETLSAIALGKDLNGPEGAIADDDEDDEDDDEPLASLPARRGSQAGSMYGGSMLGGMGGMQQQQQQQHQFAQQQFYPGHAHQTSIGGYSPLAMAPPGVDPYLYASLPNDQKMQLHQRSQQMMQMMAQAAYQAKAESQAGWETGSNVSGSSSHVGGPPQQRASVASFNSFGPGGGGMSPMMGMGMPPMMGYGAPYGAMGMPLHPPQPVPASPQSSYSTSSYQQMPRNARLPPFAPSFAMSQPMFQQSMYAGSAIGMPSGGGGGSVMGMPPTAQREARKGPASAMGMGRR
ncbi:hypothetical protein BCR35DRAFT_142278 [Leucosporidium creatinivorum]|uniref:Uncharacterized protein n=1 Tax=Leucosporidium creatinivorum TaxID=106004 RepID=A0A1Y2ERW0_9BASI|nr:hypothetical protein BCR35DRAFT_142278 [Leucosporidium creatinivorum]